MEHVGSYFAVVASPPTSSRIRLHPYCRQELTGTLFSDHKSKYFLLLAMYHIAKSLLQYNYTVEGIPFRWWNYFVCYTVLGRSLSLSYYFDSVCKGVCV